MIDNLITFFFEGGINPTHGFNINNPHMDLSIPDQSNIYHNGMNVW